jgi:hypothetical protein
LPNPFHEENVGAISGIRRFFLFSLRVSVINQTSDDVSPRACHQEVTIQECDLEGEAVFEQDEVGEFSEESRTDLPYKIYRSIHSVTLIGPLK